MKRWLVPAIPLLAAATMAQTPVAAPTAGPVNPNATPEARALLREIDAISGHFTLTGQHNFPNHVSRWSDRVYDLTGKYPALFGQDFGFSGGDDKDSTEGRPSMIEEVKRQYRSGAVIALCWHEVRPTDDEPVTFRDSVEGHLTDFEWSELLTPGTSLNVRWTAQVDVVAGYLQQLQAAGVPVLFRPYHEMNGGWFWWGGRPGPHGSAAMYRMLYDRFVNYHHLNNLIWVWNVGAPNGDVHVLEQYDPGRQYADLYTLDVYGEFKQSYYDEMLAMAGNKPIALAEVGTMPTLDVFAQQPRWAYFMMWSGMAESSNSPELVQANFHAPNLLNRSDAALARFAPAATTIAKPEPVSPNATADARTLLARLYTSTGILSGQINALQVSATAAPMSGETPLAASTELVFAATGKYPAIYSADLAETSGTDPGGTDLDAKPLIEEIKRQHAAGSIVSLRWSAPLPTAGSSSGPGEIKTNTLTDFEWNELLSPGTDLNSRWAAQVDALGALFKPLQDAHIAVLWDPYPESNGKAHWWAGRPGLHGSAALYRMLFDRLVNHDHVANLIWVWTAAPTGQGPNATGPYSDYFPGLLYTDALALDARQLQSGRRIDASLSTFGGGKPVGIDLTGGVPDPPVFAAPAQWAWFLLGPQAGSASDQALKALYADPHIVSRAP